MRLSSIAAAALSCGLCSIGLSATVVAVDFQPASGATQSGFSAFAVPTSSTPLTNQYSSTQVNGGQVSITLTGNGSLNGLTRTAISGTPANFTYANLLIDLALNLREGNNSANSCLLISGLDPNTGYTLKLWSHDRETNNNTSYTWYDTTGSTRLLGTVINKSAAGGATYPDNDAFSLTAQVTSSGTGEIRLSQNDLDGTGALNGLQLLTIPEPGTLALGGLSALGLMRRRRNKKA